MFCVSFRSAMGWSAVGYCGISWSYTLVLVRWHSLTNFNANVNEMAVEIDWSKYDTISLKLKKKTVLSVCSDE